MFINKGINSWLEPTRLERLLLRLAGSAEAASLKSISYLDWKYMEILLLEMDVIEQKSTFSEHIQINLLKNIGKYLFWKIIDDVALKLYKFEFNE